jgi:hypothetical protein
VATILIALTIVSVLSPGSPDGIANGATTRDHQTVALAESAPVAAAARTASTDVLGAPARAPQPATFVAGARIVQTPPGSEARIAQDDVARLRRHAAPAVAAPAMSQLLRPGSTAVFLGDSFTSGYNGSGLGRRNWTSIVGRTLQWHVLNLAVPGTGFRNPGWTNQPVS